METNKDTRSTPSFPDIPAELLQKYRVAYRSLTYSFTPGKECKTLFDDGLLVGESEWVRSRDQYLTWLLSDFIPFARSIHTPWIILNGDRASLNQIPISSEERSNISRLGLVIFFYEAITFRNNDFSIPWNGKDLEVIKEVQEIEDFRAKNFPSVTISVCVCELGLAQWLTATKRFPKLRFINFSTLLLHEVKRSGPYPTSEQPVESFKKATISLNFRYDPFREMLVAFLRSRPYFKNCYVSFYHRHLEAELHKRLPFDPTKLKNWPAIANGISLMQTEIPFTLDVSNPKSEDALTSAIPDFNGIYNQKNHTLLREEFYSASFLFAYIESRPFSPRSEMSEKTVNPILAMRPFLPFAAKHFLKEVRNLGFQTFANFWDEGFDEITDMSDRFDKYLQSLDSILSQPEERLRQLAKEMNPILVHNRLFLLRDFLPEQTKHLEREIRTGKPLQSRMLQRLGLHFSL